MSSPREEDEEEDDDDQTEEDHINSLKKLVKDSAPLVNGSKLEIDESLFNLEDLGDIEDELEELKDLKI